jgi:rhodanese-related sulfurtransferase
MAVPSAAPKSWAPAPRLLASLLLLLLQSASLPAEANSCAAGDNAATAGPTSTLGVSPPIHMYCKSPQQFHGPASSGWPYTLTELTRTTDATSIIVELGMSGSASSALLGFMLKVEAGTFECLPPTAQYKNCSSFTSRTAGWGESPGGTGSRQAVQHVDTTSKSPAVVLKWHVPKTTDGRLSVTAIGVSDSFEWYGRVVSFDFIPTGQTVAKLPRGPGAAGKLTLAIDMVAWNANKTKFVTEMATLLAVDPSRIKVVEVSQGSVIVTFAITGHTASDPVTAHVLMTRLLAKEADNSLYSTTLLSTTVRGSLGSLSDGVCAAEAEPKITIEECSKCKSTGVVSVMFLCAVIVAASAVLLCTTCSLCKRRDVTQRDVEWEQECNKYDAKSGAKIITCEELRQKAQAGEPIYIIDTRMAEEHTTSAIRAGSVTGVLLEPAQVGPEMKWKKDVQSVIKPPPDATIVCHCTAGYRSGFAANDLQARLGREVLNLHGGIVTWANQGGTVVNPKTGEEGAPVNPFGPKWARFLHPDIKVWFQGAAQRDDTITVGGMVKPFILMMILMIVVLIFMLVDIPSGYEDFIDWVKDIGAWGPIIAALMWIPVCLLFVPGLLLSLSCGFAFDFFPALLSVAIGATIGSTCATLAGRYLARSSIEKW